IAAGATATHTIAMTISAEKNTAPARRDMEGIALMSCVSLRESGVLRALTVAAAPRRVNGNPRRYGREVPELTHFVGDAYHALWCLPIGTSLHPPAGKVLRAPAPPSMPMGRAYPVRRARRACRGVAIPTARSARQRAGSSISASGWMAGIASRPTADRTTYP